MTRAGAWWTLVALVAAGRDPIEGQAARYRLTVDNTWSEETHPGLFPELAHFSWLGGGTHDASVSFWSAGELASPGVVEMAETGGVITLSFEVQAAVDAGSASSVLLWSWWFCPEGTDALDCGAKVVEFDVEAAHPLVTLATMLGPTPDWFVGVSGLPLRDADGWLDRVVVDLHPYDGGTREWNQWALGGPLTLPPEPISPITEESGQLVGPSSLGTFTFERIAPATGDVGALSLSAGGQQVLQLDAGPHRAGDPYLLLGSASGTQPGTPLPVHLPLNFDDYTVFTLVSANAPPLSASFGVLDETGRCATTMTVPPGSNPNLAGLQLHHAYVVFDLPLGAPLVDLASNAVALALVP